MSTEKPKQLDQEGNIWQKPLTPANAKEILFEVFKQFGGQFAFYAIFALLSTTIGAMVWVGMWFLVLFIPMIVVCYHYFTNKNKGR